jgi:hypothetical protein
MVNYHLLMRSLKSRDSFSNAIASFLLVWEWDDWKIK